MRQILFLTAFPTPSTLKDGMFQRVQNIDNLFAQTSRTFLDVKIRSYFNKEINTPEPNVTEYKLNALIHFFLIFKLIKNTEIIYLHSIHGAVWTFIQLCFSKKKICLDFHGVVPEENLIEHKKFYYYYFMFIEWISVRIASQVIYVSKAMELHFLNKYPFISRNSMVYPNYANIHKDHIPNENKTDDDNKKTVFIYSGNLQSWQNIDELLELILLYQFVPNYHFIILTGQPDTFRKKILKYNIQIDKIEINSVESEEIDKYYYRAHYGFILRSDHIVNRVANPTKMIEYLLFGIVPIVKLANIGDFMDYPYEYLSVEKFDQNLKPRKSSINQSIAKKLLNEKEDLYSFIFES